MINHIPPTRQLPERSIPVPADISPEMQKLIAQPIQTGDSTVPRTPAGEELCKGHE
jgi:hypothetical protein